MYKQIKDFVSKTALDDGDQVLIQENAGTVKKTLMSSIMTKVSDWLIARTTTTSSLATDYYVVHDSAGAAIKRQTLATVKNSMNTKVIQGSILTDGGTVTLAATTDLLFIEEATNASVASFEVTLPTTGVVEGKVYMIHVRSPCTTLVVKSGANGIYQSSSVAGTLAISLTGSGNTLSFIKRPSTSWIRIQ